MYCGLDASLKTTYVTIINDKGKKISEAEVATDVLSLSNYLKSQHHEYKKIGIESGQLSIHLCKGLIKEGFKNVICLDARHTARLLSLNINKNDKNDAFGIGEILRLGFYKEVRIKSDTSCDLKILIGSRRQLVNNRQKLMGTIRGLLKIYGIKLPKGARCNREIILSCLSKDLESSGRLSIISLLNVIDEMSISLSTIDEELKQFSKQDEDCKLLMTIPGVGEVTSITFKATIDSSNRFKHSKSVGAYLGITPRQYSSGEVNRHGSISKMGSKECRSMIYESAQSFLVISKKSSKLKSWGKKIAKKKGNKKAIVAVARKLSVIMHRMLLDKTEFRYQ